MEEHAWGEDQIHANKKRTTLLDSKIRETKSIIYKKKIPFKTLQQESNQ